MSDCVSAARAATRSLVVAWKYRSAVSGRIQVSNGCRGAGGTSATRSPACSTIRSSAAASRRRSPKGSAVRPATANSARMAGGTKSRATSWLCTCSSDAPARGPEFLKTVAQASPLWFERAASRSRHSSQTSCQPSGSMARMLRTWAGDSITTSCTPCAGLWVRVWVDVWAPVWRTSPACPACPAGPAAVSVTIGNWLGTIRARHGSAAERGDRSRAGGVSDSFPAQNGQRIVAPSNSLGRWARPGATKTVRAVSGSWWRCGVSCVERMVLLNGQTS